MISVRDEVIATRRMNGFAVTGRRMQSILREKNENSPAKTWSRFLGVRSIGSSFLPDERTEKVIEMV